MVLFLIFTSKTNWLSVRGFFASFDWHFITVIRHHSLVVDSFSCSYFFVQSLVSTRFFCGDIINSAV